MKIFHTLGNPITSGDEVHFRISEGSTATSEWKTVKRILHRNQCQPALPGQEAVCMPKWWLGAEAQASGSDLRERTGAAGEDVEKRESSYTICENVN